MFRSFRLGRVAGIDLFIHPTFWILLLYPLVVDRSAIDALFTIALFACVVLHELGHALTARLYRIETRDITLYPIGGVARLERMPRSPGAELLITIAGPLTNVAIAGVLAVAVWFGERYVPHAVGHFVMMLIGVNLALAIFNLIPAFPMDGGRIFRAILSSWLGRLRATEVAARVGQAIALVLPLVLILIGHYWILSVLLGGFVFFAARAELESVRSEESALATPHVAQHIAFGFGTDPSGLDAPPAGFEWVPTGQGAWQLVPVLVVAEAMMREPGEVGR